MRKPCSACAACIAAAALSFLGAAAAPIDDLELVLGGAVINF